MFEVIRERQDPKIETLKGGVESLVVVEWSVNHVVGFRYEVLGLPCCMLLCVLPECMSKSRECGRRSGVNNETTSTIQRCTKV